jgi:D-lactate dehydrogenase
MHVYFYEAFEEEMNLLRSLLGRDLTYEFTSSTIQETRHKKPLARLISIRTQSIVPPSWAEELDGVLSRSTGFDHLLAYDSQIKKQLPLGYLEEYSTRAVAEHAIMMTMALVRKLPQQMRQFGVFDRDGLTGAECSGKNLLVVGVGRIGSEIVRIASGLGFAVKGVDIVPNKPEVIYVPREEGIVWADVIVCAMNLTKQNEGYFSYDLLKSGRKGCVFVNVARGEHSPLAGLKRLLDERHLAGVGLDVFEEEGTLAVALRNPASPPTPEVTLISQLLARPNVLLTPHNAFNTQEALQRKAAMSVEQIRHFMKHRDFVWKV